MKRFACGDVCAAFLYFSWKPIYSLAKGSHGRERWEAVTSPVCLTEEVPPAKIGETHLAPGHPCISCLYFTRILNQIWNCNSVLGPLAVSGLLHELYLLAPAFECYFYTMIVGLVYLIFIRQRFTLTPGPGVRSIGPDDVTDWLLLFRLYWCDSG